MKPIMKYLLLLLLLPGSTNLYARLKGQPLIDSLLKELPKQREDTNKVKMLDDLAYYYNSINPDEGIKYGQQSLDLATTLNWKKGMANANNDMGIIYRHKSDHPKALEYYLKTLNLDEEMGNKKGVTNVTDNIGNIYLDQSDYPKALEYYFKALKLAEEIGYKQQVAIATGNIGNIYRIQGDYPKALEYYLKALKMHEEAGNKAGVASVTGNIGAIYVFQKNYAMAIEYMQKALKMHEELGNKGEMARNLGNMGAVYGKQKNYIMAVEYIQRALKINEELGDKALVASDLNNIGGIYLEIIKEPDVKVGKVTDVAELSVNKYRPTVSIPNGKAALLSAAIDYDQRSLVKCKEINDLDIMQNSYEGLSEAYKLKGDYKRAMEYGDSLKIIKDSVFSLENSKKIKNLENDRKAYGDSLKAAAAQRAANIQATHRRNYELIGGAVILLLIGFTFFIARNNKLLDKEKKRSDNLLLNILPEEVADQLKDTGKSAAKQFDNVTVLFTDFVNFTEASGRMKPEALIEELDTCFKRFDAITGKYGVEKIKTIGDAYLAVCGLPHPNPEHALNIVRAATEINAFMQDREAKMGNSTFKIRIGIHTGSVIAGIVGDKKFAYDIWGDTVNTAARMEQNSEAGRINISEATFELVKDKISCTYRGEIDAKGKGMMKMYYVS